MREGCVTICNDYVSQALGTVKQAQSLETVPAFIIPECEYPSPRHLSLYQKTPLSQHANVCDQHRFTDYSQQQSPVCCVNEAETKEFR